MFEEWLLRMVHHWQILGKTKIFQAALPVLVSIDMVSPCISLWLHILLCGQCYCWSTNSAMCTYLALFSPLWLSSDLTKRLYLFLGSNFWIWSQKKREANPGFYISLYGLWVEHSLRCWPQSIHIQSKIQFYWFKHSFGGGSICVETTNRVIISWVFLVPEFWCQ